MAFKRHVHAARFAMMVDGHFESDDPRTYEERMIDGIKDSYARGEIDEDQLDRDLHFAMTGEWAYYPVNPFAIP